MSEFRIGNAIISLTDLIDDPHPIEVLTQQIGFTLAGNPINSAFETIIWRWTNMSQPGWNQIMEFWKTNVEIANPPAHVYITSRKETGEIFEFGNYKCRMGKPVSTVDAVVSQIRNGQVTFYQCELLS